jgi:hypothetical protein
MVELTFATERQELVPGDDEMRAENLPNRIYNLHSFPKDMIYRGVEELRRLRFLSLLFNLDVVLIHLHTSQYS